MDANKLIKSLSSKSYILVPHIDKYQAAGVFPDKWKIEISNTRVDDGYFHPSSDCAPSAEELFLGKSGQLERERINPLLRRAFDCGTMWHGYYENILIDMGLIDSDNVEKYHIHHVSTYYGDVIAAGTGDLINLNIPGNGRWLVDLKTMNKRNFDSPPKSLMDKYKAQVNIYSDFFDLDRIMILAICKDSPHDLKEIIIQKDEELIESIYHKWGRVQRGLELGKLPD